VAVLEPPVASNIDEFASAVNFRSRPTADIHAAGPNSSQADIQCSMSVRGTGEVEVPLADVLHA
jgi:hypothetical protein